MVDEVKSSLDPDALRSRTTKMPYPNIHIKDLNKCVPIVVNSLEEGSLPLLGTLNGVTKIIKKISESSYNINKLLRVTSLEVNINEGYSRNIETISDYMEVAMEWI